MSATDIHSWLDLLLTVKPIVVIPGLWLYVFIAAIAFGLFYWIIVHWVIYGWVGYVWTREIRRRYGERPGMSRPDPEAMAFNIIMGSAYAVTAYFAMFGLSLACYGILVAVDIFTERYRMADSSFEEPFKPTRLDMQIQALLASLVLDGVVASLWVTATVLFHHFIAYS